MYLFFHFITKEFNNFVILFIGLHSFTYLQAQESVNASGGNASGSGGTVSYSIGQVVYTTNIALNGSVAQGVQHAYEVLVVNVIKEEINFSLELFPNPTTDVLYLKTSPNMEEGLRYSLCDVNGKLIRSNPIIKNQSEIDMKELALGTYLIHVSKNSKNLKTYKVIKSN